MSRRLSTTAVVLAALLLAGCSMSERANRRTLNALDEHVAPESDGARWAWAPVGLPMAFVAWGVDFLVVHPACSIDDAWGDTVEWLWTSHGETRFRRAVFIPLAALATPFVFVGDWVGRWILDIDPREDDGDETEDEA